MSYAEFVEYMQRISDVKGAVALLSWDKEVNILPQNEAFRARQIGYLSRLAHEMFISDKLGDILIKLKNDTRLNEVQKRNVEKTWEDYEKARRIPPELVEEFSETTARAFHAWHTAKKEKKFEIFAPSLEHIVNLCKQMANYLGYEKHPYDALLDIYEEDLTVDTCDALFSQLKKPLKDIVNEIMSTGYKIREDFLKRNFNIEKQKEFNKFLIIQMGFDLRRGAIHISPHPFTTHTSPFDVRITTAYSENDITRAIFSTIHEFGHALYEMNLSEAEYGLPAGTSLTLGIHESQSRLWENYIGRSLPFWKFFYPVLKGYFYEQLHDVSLQEFYEVINKVEPSLIRIYADEITYHFHIIIRYEIEKALIEGSITVNDVPTLWNKKYEEYLGVVPSHDGEGCLQDIHWSHGSIGYFPTYSLGSLYAAMFYKKMREDIPDMDEQIREGSFSQIVAWLRDNIHQHGSLYKPYQLCQRITGSTLSIQPFLDYIQNKFFSIYGITQKISNSTGRTVLTHTK